MERSERGEASVARRAKQTYSQYVDAARQSHAQVQPAQNATDGLRMLLIRLGQALTQGRLGIPEDVRLFQGNEPASHAVGRLELGSRLILGEQGLLAAGQA